jgi:hypothetical protein
VFLANLLVRRVQHGIALRSLKKKVAFRSWDFSRFKTSDTLFILASGASIADLAPEQLALIRRHDSVGFNFWLLHPLVPTYLILEFLPECQRSDQLWANLNLRATEYAEVPIIFKYSAALVQQIGKIPRALRHVYLARHLSIPGKGVRGLSLWLRLLDRWGLFSGATNGLILFRQASLSWLLVFALRLGYRRIVYCGADLKSPEYFFEADGAFARSRGLHVPTREFTTVSHPTNIATHCSGGLTIADVLSIFDDEVLSRRGARIFVGASTSALSPRFPVFPWREDR